MKRVIDGITYNTETATEIFLQSQPFSQAGWAMYQTRNGAFFSVAWDIDRAPNSCTPLSRPEARRKLEEHASYLVEEYFGFMPKHAAMEKRLTLRIPYGLFKRIENAATTQDIDVNKYIQRILEKAAT